MVSYWIKAASNTFENTYWLKKIDLVFITSGAAKPEASNTNAQL